MKFRKNDILRVTQTWDNGWSRYPKWHRRLEEGRIGFVISRGLRKEKTEEAPRQWQYQMIFPPSVDKFVVPEDSLEKIGTMNG